MLSDTKTSDMTAPLDAPHAAPEQRNESNPLDQLSDLLQDDMKQVNRLIIENMQSDVDLIPQLAQYLIAAGGKRIRPLLTIATAQLCDAPMDKTYVLAAAVEFIHTATLLHDDVVDDSTERRGQDAANVVFGNKSSVLVGDFLFSKAFEMMVRSESLDVLNILSHASAVIAQGEVLQLITANDIKTDIAAYMDVIEAKTAALFAASCEVGAVLAGCDEDIVTALRTYGAKLGVAFQIIDDALDYAADHVALGKTIGDDFREGKMTAPVIYALNAATDEERSFWQRTLGQTEQKDGDFDTAMTIITRHKGLDQTIALARDYIQQAVDSLQALPHTDMRDLLAALAVYTIERRF